jgi:hypothetical protein
MQYVLHPVGAGAGCQTFTDNLGSLGTRDGDNNCRGVLACPRVIWSEPSGLLHKRQPKIVGCQVCCNSSKKARARQAVHQKLGSWRVQLDCIYSTNEG